MATVRTDRRSVSVLVVSWRTRELLERMIESTLRTLEADCPGWAVEVIVVDNDPSDGTSEMVRRRFGEDPRVTLIESSWNSGYAEGNNRALRQATGYWLVVANPDLVLCAGQIAALVDHLDTHPEAGLATATLVGPDGGRQHMHRGLPELPLVFGYYTRTGRRIDHRLLGGRLRRRYLGMDLPQQGVVDMPQAAGAFLALGRRTLDLIGGSLFDEAMPILVNDVDLSRRVHDAGLEVHLLAGCRVEHLGGGSLDQLGRAEMQGRLWAGLHAYYRSHEPRWKRAALAAIEPRAARTARRGPVAEVPEVPGLDPAPLVSIVVISYNYGHFLGEAIESALHQSWPKTEIVVVDDGSTDDTAQVAARFAPAGVRYLHKPNGGLSQARNVGARVAAGSLVVFLDADDRLEPEMVEHCIEALARDPGAAFAFPQVRSFGDAESVTALTGWDIDRLKAGNYIQPTYLIHAPLVRSHRYDETNRVGWEDWDFLLALAEEGHHGVLVDEPLVCYRRHGSNMTAAIVGKTSTALLARVLRRHARFVGYRRWLAAERRNLRLRAGLARRRLRSRRSL